MEIAPYYFELSWTLPKWLSRGEINAGSQSDMLVGWPSEFPLENLRIKCLDWFSVQKLKLQETWDNLSSLRGWSKPSWGIVTQRPSGYSPTPASSILCQNRNQLISPTLPPHQNLFLFSDFFSGSWLGSSFNQISFLFLSCWIFWLDFGIQLFFITLFSF